MKMKEIGPPEGEQGRDNASLNEVSFNSSKMYKVYEPEECLTYISDVIDRTFTSVVQGAVVTLAHETRRSGTQPARAGTSSANH